MFPGIALMIMAKQAATGGETILLDASSLARIAEAEAPELFIEMTTLPVNMALPPATGSHEPVLQKRDGRWSMRWNYYRVVPGQGERVDAFRENFHAFVARVAATSEAEVFRLEEGDALVLDDGGVLHGRPRVRGGCRWRPPHVENVLRPLSVPRRAVRPGERFRERDRVRHDAFAAGAFFR